MSPQSILSDDTLAVNQFHLLSYFQQKIFQFLQYLAKTYKNVFPSIETILKNIGCARATVFRALTALEKIGWVVRINRGYNQTNLYCVPFDLIDLDFSKPEINLREGCDVNETLLYTYKDTNTHTCDPHEGFAHGSLMRGREALKRIEPPAPLNPKVPFPSWWPKALRLDIFKSSQHFSLRWVQSVPEEAINACKDECREYDKRLREKKGFVHNHAALLIKKLKKYVNL